MAAKSPHARAWSRAVDNEELLQVVCTVARASAPRVYWPAELPAHDAPRIAHAFVKHHTRYIREAGDQYVRTPAAFVRERTGDCKSTAVFIGTLCKAAGHSVVLRFVRFPGRSHYGHVFPVVNGIPADPLLELGDECVYLQRRDIRL